MTLISAGTLTWLRGIQEDFLPETVTIQRAPLVNDGYSNRFQDWANATETTVAGRITTTRQTSQEREIADQVQPQTTYTVRVPFGTDVRETDRLVIAGRTYEVLGVLRESYPTIQRLVVMESTSQAVP